MNIIELIKSERHEPVNIIHGTDWWTDCDDIVALRLLCRAHKAGIINLMCVCANAVMEYSASSIDAFITSEGLSIPVGLDKSACSSDDKCLYQKVLSQYPHTIQSNDECEQAYRLYRKMLASLNGKADITEVGFPQVIHQLLISPPDDISPLSGMELVKSKVNKIWMMAGKWDEPNGREYNLCHTPASRMAGSYICDNCPVPITFLGFEVGNSVITGANLPDGDILAHGMKAYGCQKGRYSWDPMLTLMAIIGDEERAGYKKITGTATVNPESGENNFSKASCGRHSYVVKMKPDSYYENMINDLIAPDK